MKFILEAFIVMRLMNISICSINTQERDLFSLILRNETSRAYRMEIPYKAQTNVNHYDSSYRSPQKSDTFVRLSQFPFFLL